MDVLLVVVAMSIVIVLVLGICFDGALWRGGLPQSWLICYGGVGAYVGVVCA